MDDDVVGKVLGAWAEKSERGAAPANPDRLRDRISKPVDSFAQLNFKVSPAMKSRIKQLAARDSISLLAMLYQMVELYESKHGALSQK
jgi:hypothetical protein